MSRSTLRPLREGRLIADRAFDEMYPKWARTLSGTHFTPVDVAVRAARWLTGEADDIGDMPTTTNDARPVRVLDVGAGVGKFCLVGALATRGAFTGVELRPRLAAVATEMARRQSIKRCSFVAGDAFALDWNDFDAFYLFNPFAEFLPECPFIDNEIDRTAEQYHRYVSAVETRLEALAEGTRLVTYHGFGGRMPFGWNPITSLRMHAGSLALWRKVRPPEMTRR
ncbi:MAG TPA: methyltransferase domain-containing protein [Polyangia bacterium]